MHVVLLCNVHYHWLLHVTQQSLTKQYPPFRSKSYCYLLYRSREKHITQLTTLKHVLSDLYQKYNFNSELCISISSRWVNAIYSVLSALYPYPSKT